MTVSDYVPVVLNALIFTGFLVAIALLILLCVHLMHEAKYP